MQNEAELASCESAVCNSIRESTNNPVNVVMVQYGCGLPYPNSNSLIITHLLVYYSTIISVQKLVKYKRSTHDYSLANKGDKHLKLTH